MQMANLSSSNIGRTLTISPPTGQAERVRGHPGGRRHRRLPAIPGPVPGPADHPAAAAPLGRGRQHPVHPPHPLRLPGGPGGLSTFRNQRIQPPGDDVMKLLFGGGGGILTHGCLLTLTNGVFRSFRNIGMLKYRRSCGRTLTLIKTARAAKQIQTVL